MTKELEVWFVQDAEDENVFALPYPAWTATVNATRNHYHALTFATEAEALDWCYAYAFNNMRWSPRLITFEREQLH